MRRRAAVDHALPDDAETAGAHAPISLSRRVRRQRERDVIENARGEHVDLPATVLLRWSADELDRHTEVLLGGGVQEGADVRHGDEVVTAAVTHAFEGVVLRNERDRRTGRADTRAEGRLEAADTHLHFMTMRLQERGYPCCSATLLVRDLRIGVDLAGELQELFGELGGK